MNTHYQTIILGGGLSGLTVAHKLRLKQPGHRFLLLEKSGHTGGVIKTWRDRGFISEAGPHGFLDNCPESQQLLAETGLDRECIKAPLIDFVRYVYLNKNLNLIPQTPKKILLAPLISWRAKARVLLDLCKPALGGEPTVAKWVDYRFGPALLPYLDAVYTGTYAGDYNRLTIDSVMVGLRRIEKTYGSVLYGLFREMRNKKKLRPKGEKRSFTMPAMTSFPEGMSRLVEKLAEPLTPDKDLLLNGAASSAGFSENSWHVESTRGTFTADNLVFALPINQSLKLLARLDPAIPERSVPESWIATVVFGFTNSTQIPPGFGYLIPECEKRFTLGTLFSSNMFEKRAPEGHIVFETLVGGRRHPERLELDDAALTEKALADTREILKISAEPVYSRVFRSGGGIPQLEKNYPALLEWRSGFKEIRRGVEICGFGWDGIGLNDMMKHASRAAEAVLSGSSAQRKTEIKGVYF
jgi:oxygen-dependent protoporphyrinogen oxidase